MRSGTETDDALCPRCGTALRAEPIPVTLRETILILVVLIFAGTTILRAQENVWALATAPVQILGVVGLGVFWFISHRDTSTARCIPCTVSWRPEAVFAFRHASPTAVLLAMFGLSGFTVIVGLAGEQAFYLLALAPFLYLILRYSLAADAAERRTRT
jgi:hypothetical protein